MAGAVHIPLPAVSMRATVPCGFCDTTLAWTAASALKASSTFQLEGFLALQEGGGLGRRNHWSARLQKIKTNPCATL